MKQKLLSFLLALSALTLTACAGPDSFSDIVTTELPELSVNDFLDSSGAAPEEAPVTAAPEEDPGTTAGSDGVQWEDPAAPSLDEDGTYNSKDDVSLYLHLYDHLPSNYITKGEARGKACRSKKRKDKKKIKNLRR